MLSPSPVAEIPAAILRKTGDLPMVKIGPGVSIQLLQVDFDHNIRKYLEYPESSESNSYLYEPACSAHTLHVPKDSPVPADVIFIVHGSNIELGAGGEYEGATDAMAIARAYLNGCKEQGLPRPRVIGLPLDWEA